MRVIIPPAWGYEKNLNVQYSPYRNTDTHFPEQTQV